MSRRSLFTEGLVHGNYVGIGGERALTFYGGVPQLIIPDNPRALVSKADRYEPVLIDTVQDFPRHYGCSVLPARAYHPQDKPKVELSVLLVERWILARLCKFKVAL